MNKGSLLNDGIVWSILTQRIKELNISSGFLLDGYPRVCSSCGTNFNIAEIKHQGYNLPSKKPLKRGKCDSCNGKLVPRKDDSRRSIQKRLFEYKVHTLPLEEYFEKKDKILEFTAYGGIDDFPMLLSEIKLRLGIK